MVCEVYRDCPPLPAFARACPRLPALARVSLRLPAKALFRIVVVDVFQSMKVSETF